MPKNGRPNNAKQDVRVDDGKTSGKYMRSGKRVSVKRREKASKVEKK